MGEMQHRQIAWMRLHHLYSKIHLKNIRYTIKHEYEETIKQNKQSLKSFKLWHYIRIYIKLIHNWCIQVMIISNDIDIDHVNNNFHHEYSIQNYKYNIQNYKYIIHYSASSSIFCF